jgi:glycosyltransferase involved in cell wall biosynthesis
MDCLQSESSYDDDSTDGTIDILKAHKKVEVRRFEREHPHSFELSKCAVFNHCWKEARGSADWVIIVDCDELIFHARLIEYLEEQKLSGVTLIPTLGFEMVTDQFPGPEEFLATSRTKGAPDLQLSKPCVFDPAAIEQSNFTVGQHNVRPVGRISLPAHDELMLLHYKFLGPDYLCQRYFELLARRGKVDRLRGWNRHYAKLPEQLRNVFDTLKRRSVDIATPGFSPNSAHPVPSWREYTVLSLAAQNARDHRLAGGLGL